MTNTPEAQQQPMPITISGQYIKDFSFESPNAPQIFAPTQNPPAIDMMVNIATRGVGQNAYEVVLSLKMDAKLDGKTAFIAELAYAGIFAMPQMPEEHLRMFLLVEGPRLLFPFARTILMNAIRDGGFPHITVNPVDFMGLYLANKDQVGTMPAVGAA